MNEPHNSGTEGILANLFKGILNDLRITAGKGSRWEDLMRNFLNDRRNGIRQNDRDRSSARGNLAKELLKPKMTWKVFCKGMRFIGLTKFEISIVAHHYSGQKTIHSATVNMVETFEEEEDTQDATQSAEC